MPEIGLVEELRKTMSLTRLAKTGLFRRLDTEGYDLIRRELVLHRTVLDKALTDWFSDNKKVRRDVEFWLDLNNQDFIEACERALLQPEKVYETFFMVKRILRGKNARFRKFNDN